MYSYLANSIFTDTCLNNFLYGLSFAMASFTTFIVTRKMLYSLCPDPEGLGTTAMNRAIADLYQLERKVGINLQGDMAVEFLSAFLQIETQCVNREEERRRTQPDNSSIQYPPIVANVCIQNR